MGLGAATVGLLNLLWETLVWVYRTSVAVVAWSIAHPIPALIVTMALRASASWLRQQPWLGAALLADLSEGLATVFMWTAIITVVTEVAVEGVVDFVTMVYLWVTGQGGPAAIVGRGLRAAGAAAPGSVFPTVIDPLMLYQ